MEFKGLTSASHMSIPEAGYGSEEGQLGSEISGAVSGVTTPGASRLQASQLQERSTTMQRLQEEVISNSSRIDEIEVDRDDQERNPDISSRKEGRTIGVPQENASIHSNMSPSDKNQAKNVKI